MQASSTASAAGRAPATGLASSSASASRPCVVCCPARRQQQRRACVANAAPLVLSTAAAAAAAWWLSRQQQEAETDADQLDATFRRPCPSCEGTGYESCACTRWSDGDVGCSSCSHTGYMRCRSCNGGGTAVPIRVTVRKTNNL